MRYRFNFFAKMNLIILLMVVPVVILYSYSNNVSERVVSSEMERSNANQLDFLLYQLDAKIEQSMLFAYTFKEDPNVKKFKGIYLFENDYDLTTTKRAIEDKLTYQTVNPDWENEYTVYAVNKQEAISSEAVPFDRGYLKSNISTRWKYFSGEEKGKPNAAGTFRWFTSDYGDIKEVSSANVIIEIRFGPHNIQNLLDQYKGDGRGDPFLYKPGAPVIMNRTANEPFIRSLTKKLEQQLPEGKQSSTITIDNEAYMVNVVKSSSLDWYLVDYVPVKSLLSPIQVSRNLFYTCIALLVSVGFLASLLIYRNIQKPIGMLVRSIQTLKRGDYSVQVQYTGTHEFSYLFNKFNEMSRQIKELIENVYLEKLRAKEATLKQLQSQINPHFLYNCLGFIINMAKMNQSGAVVSMAHNLSDYYRYTTRLEKNTSMLKDEISLLKNYLDIQILRMDRIWYDIDVPDKLQTLEVPRLLLQPVVENAIVHGISLKGTSGYIRITGHIQGNQCRLIVEDDGKGLSDNERFILQQKLNQPLTADIGFGTWNVNQRLQHYFGESAGLKLDKSELGGVRAVLYWEITETT